MTVNERGSAVTTPETPADLLRRVARRLDLLAAPLADHVWQAETDEDDEDEWVIASEGPTMQTEHGPVMLGGQWTVARDVPETVARWAGLVGPQIAAPLSSWLRAEADCAETLPEVSDALGRLGAAVEENATRKPAKPWGVQVNLSPTSEAVAFARALLGETEKTP